MSGLPSPGRLQGRLVLLRDPREADAAGLARAFVDDPGLGAAIGVETDPGEAEWRALSAEEPVVRAQRRRLNLVVAGASDEPLGLVGLHTLAARHFRAEASIWLAPGARGAGRGVEALRLLTDWAMRALALQRLQLTTMADNSAMIHSAERAGYALEGVLRSYTFERGRAVDNAMLAVVA